MIDTLYWAAVAKLQSLISRAGSDPTTSYTTRLATADSHAVVVSDVGLIPLRLPHLGVKTHEEILGVDSMHLVGFAVVILQSWLPISM